MNSQGVVAEIYGVAEVRRRRGTARRAKRVRSVRRGTGEFAFETCKEQGEWAELCFMARARQMGMTVLKPYGDSSAHDIGIEVNGRLLRVQAKSTTFQRGRTFTCNFTGPGGKAYPAGMVDYFAVYLIPVDMWYILPFEKARKTSVSLQFTRGRPGTNTRRTGKRGIGCGRRVPTREANVDVSCLMEGHPYVRELPRRHIRGHWIRCW
jgi:hypothetical protein